MSDGFDWERWQAGEEVAAALEAGDKEALDRLAETHPDLLKPDAERLLEAVQCQPLSTIQWLADHGAPVRIETDDGFPLLHIAVDREGSDRYDVVRDLVGRGADVNERGFNDWTPLHRAAAGNDTKMALLLLELGADPGLETRIDACANAEDEARLLGKTDSADAIARWRRDTSR